MSGSSYPDTMTTKQCSPAAAREDYRSWFGWRFVVLGTLLCMASVYLAQLIGEAPVRVATQSVGLACTAVLIAGIAFHKWRARLLRREAAGRSAL